MIRRRRASAVRHGRLPRLFNSADQFGRWPLSARRGLAQARPGTPVISRAGCHCSAANLSATQIG
eukprot:753609-Hanusia_phi.AAC.1